MPQPLKHHYSSTFLALQQLVAEVTGDEPNDVMHDLDLDQLTMEDFVILIRKINAHFHIHLQAKTVLDDYETLEELSDLIDEEMELG